MLTDDRTIHDILSAVEHSRIPPLESVKAICTRVLEAETRVKVLEDALRWYGEQARLAKLIHSEGDSGRNALAKDGGDRARKALEEALKDPL